MHNVKSAGRVVSAGLKWAAWWAVPVNLGVWYLAHQYATTFEGYAEPWSHLAGFVSHLDVESLMLDAVYIAWGTKAAS
jgi:hypothetical protein